MHCVTKGYFKAKRGYVMYSMNESHIHAMHVGVRRGEYFCNPYGIINWNIPLAFKTIAIERDLFNKISLEEERKTSHMKNKRF